VDEVETDVITAGRIGGVLLIGGALSGGVGVVVRIAGVPSSNPVYTLLLLLVAASWGLGLRLLSAVEAEPFGDQGMHDGLFLSAVAAFVAVLLVPLLAWAEWADSPGAAMLIFVPVIGLEIIGGGAVVVGISKLAIGLSGRGGQPGNVGRLLATGLLAGIAGVVVSLLRDSAPVGVIGIAVLAIALSLRGGRTRFVAPLLAIVLIAAIADVVLRTEVGEIARLNALSISSLVLGLVGIGILAILADRPGSSTSSPDRVRPQVSSPAARPRRGSRRASTGGRPRPSH